MIKKKYLNRSFQGFFFFEANLNIMTRNDRKQCVIFLDSVEAVGQKKKLNI